ncbi:MAG: hypothetical protein ACJ8AT_35625 [Hyalangium sp.]|uniref:hypothetical protein n=1 Tax=Hyalangium sp. TaxID=2028555 RepID=UPI00389A0A49
MLGCAQGSLVGTRPCADSKPGAPVYRQYVFPYRDDHTLEILRRLREAVPEEFPRGQGFYRFRRHFAVTVATGTGEEQVGKAKRLLRHKYLSSTDSYLRTVVGVQASAEDLAGVDAAMDSTLSPCGTPGDNAEGQSGSQTSNLQGG